MEAAGVQADVGTFNTLINACAGQGEVERALCVVQRMQQEGVAPDAITYTSLLKACAFHQGKGMVTLAEEVFSQMVQRTNHFTTYIAPTERTYQRLMQVYLHASPPRTGRIWDLVETMRNNDISPSNFTWRVCARAAAKDGDVERALQVIECIRSGPSGGSCAVGRLGFDFKAWDVVAAFLEGQPGRAPDAERLRLEMKNRYQPRA